MEEIKQHNTYYIKYWLQKFLLKKNKKSRSPHCLRRPQLFPSQVVWKFCSLSDLYLEKYQCKSAKIRFSNNTSEVCLYIIVNCHAHHVHENVYPIFSDIHAFTSEGFIYMVEKQRFLRENLEF